MSYNVHEDLELIKIIDEDELSPYSVSTYYARASEFCKCIGKPYSDIVKEVKDLQRDKIIGNDIIRYNPNDSLINDYIHQYVKFLKDKNNKKSTINLKVSQVLILLNKSNIEVPKVSFKKEAKQTRVQLITSDDIRYVLKNSNVHHKALITFMASTGIRRYDVVNNFTIEDYMEGCSDYIKVDNLCDFLDNAPHGMIPYFEFVPNKTKKTGLPCKVCCSAEASDLILDSLKARQKSIKRHNREYDDDLILTEESPLFSSKKKNYVGKLGEHSVTMMFYRKNQLLQKYKKLLLDDQLRNHEITKKEWKVKKESIPSFHPHSLRHRFISTVRAYTTNTDISLLMEGHASSIATDKYYVGESEELFNKESIKRTYREVMPYLTFFEDVDPLSYIKEKEKNEELENEIKSLKKRLKEYEKLDYYLKGL